MRPRILWTTKEDKIVKSFAEKGETDYALIAKEIVREGGNVRTATAVQVRMTSLKRALKKNGEDASLTEIVTEAAALPKPKKKSKPLVLPSAEIITNLRKGEHAYIPGRGVVRSNGWQQIDDPSSAVHGMKVIELQEVFTKNLSKTMMLPSQFAAKQVRTLAPVEALDNIVAHLEGASSLGAMPGNTTQKKLNHIKELEQSAELKDAVELLIRIFRPHNDGPIPFIDKGYEALDRMAGEYAVVKKVPFKEAQQVFSEALGLKTSQKAEIAPGIAVPAL